MQQTKKKNSPVRNNNKHFFINSVAFSNVYKGPIIIAAKLIIGITHIWSGATFVPPINQSWQKSRNRVRIV